MRCTVSLLKAIGPIAALVSGQLAVDGASMALEPIGDLVDRHAMPEVVADEEAIE